jgi:hypothetical protein
MRPLQLVTGRVWRGSAFGARGRTDVPKIVDWYMDGKIAIDPLITHTMPLERINDAFTSCTRANRSGRSGFFEENKPEAPLTDGAGPQPTDVLHLDGMITFTVVVTSRSGLRCPSWASSSYEPSSEGEGLHGTGRDDAAERSPGPRGASVRHRFQDDRGIGLDGCHEVRRRHHPHGPDELERKPKGGGRGCPSGWRDMASGRCWP